MNKLIETIKWKIAFFKADRAMKKAEKQGDFEKAGDLWAGQHEFAMQYEYEKKHGYTW